MNLITINLSCIMYYKRTPFRVQWQSRKKAAILQMRTSLNDFQLDISTNLRSVIRNHATKDK